LLSAIRRASFGFAPDAPNDGHRVMDRVYVIAEAGVNHNGSPQVALEMVRAAARAGADAVKFQTFRAESLASASAPKAGYQIDTTDASESQLEMIHRLELDEATHVALIERCGELGIDFLSAPFDLESAEMLARLGLQTFKLPSGAVTDLPLLRLVGSFGVRVILSTGMATLEEAGAAVQALVASGTSRDGITVLHCTTEYPTPPADVNLRAMHTLADALGLPVGYSDHTNSIAVPIAAVALGACVIEKHFTLDRSMEGPDHRASLEPDELAQMVAAIRVVEAALGSAEKRPTVGEIENARAARKSIVAACEIRAGETLSDDNLTTKRPGTGLSPMLWDDVVGTASTRDFAKDEAIEL
jgi:N,N'-diacetyllegionaminate synthase